VIVTKTLLERVQEVVNFMLTRRRPVIELITQRMKERREKLIKVVKGEVG